METQTLANTLPEKESEVSLKMAETHVPDTQTEEKSQIQPTSTVQSATEGQTESPINEPQNLNSPDQDSIMNALCQVIDPELHMNIVELGLVYTVTLETSQTPPSVEVEMTLTSPGCPYGPVIMGQVPTILKQTFGDSIGEVEVHLTFSPPWDPATMASEDVKFELGIF